MMPKWLLCKRHIHGIRFVLPTHLLEEMTAVFQKTDLSSFGNLAQGDPRASKPGIRVGEPGMGWKGHFLRRTPGCDAIARYLREISEQKRRFGKSFSSWCRIRREGDNALR